MWAPMFTESFQGVSNKLPTRDGNLNQTRVQDNLNTAGGIVVSRVGGVGLVPSLLTELASLVIEWGAAALTELQDFPEQSTEADSAYQSYWRTFTMLTDTLVKGVEALGGEPDVQERPIFTFDPPALTPYQQF